MRGLAMDFTNADTGPVFDFSAPLVDFDTTVQNAVVNLGTQAGSDSVFASRGTTLQLDAAQGRMINTVWASQTCNFAALAVLDFSQKTELQSNAFKLQNFVITASTLDLQNATLAVTATSVLGEVVGVTATA